MVARFLAITAIGLFFLASQLFWIRRLREWGEKFISSQIWRRRLAALAATLYIVLLVYNVFGVGRGSSPTHLALKSLLLEAPFGWWVVGSMASLGLLILFWVADRLWRAGAWIYRMIVGAQHAVPARDLADPPSPDRRRFLEQTAVAVSTAPFVAGAYGLFYGRLNLETSRQRLRLRRLPRAFDGLRIAQLSDIHIGPFMSAEEIRKYVEITNQLRPDLVMLTGDFITWDSSTQGAVVKALAGLKAPWGIFGCLGNHEMWTETEDSITRLFASAGIRILRQERAPVQSHGESMNLIGVDFQTLRPMGRYRDGLVPQYLQGVERLLRPDTVNILLSHNPNTFDRAAELGIDLSLAGHTHGGQISLEFIHPSLSPSRLITRYVRGWFQKGSAQLYVNRGLGTIFVPIRLYAPPEVTVLELVREV